MRVVYLFLLLLFVGAMAIFVVQNNELATVRFLNYSVSWHLSLVVVIAYFLGMLTGWTLIGFVRRSLRRVSQRPPD